VRGVRVQVEPGNVRCLTNWATFSKLGRTAGLEPASYPLHLRSNRALRTGHRSHS